MDEKTSNQLINLLASIEKKLDMIVKMLSVKKESE
tara:strand:- start:711 stop:815 length:105 start_codon:yes stop_codon:yes gene_type:complete